MLSHEQVWAAIDALAERHALSVSGLARRAGLDSTAFNKSKRHSADGRPRWPSTESLAKIMEATGASFRELIELVEAFRSDASPPPRRRTAPTLPLMGRAQAGTGGYFDDAGFPVGQGLEEIDPPAEAGEGAYALKVSGDSMMPLYRDGDILIVQPGASLRKGDRVVAKTRGGEVMAKVLAARPSETVTLTSLNPVYPDRALSLVEIEWMARIVWASQ